jgi:hypothetical protein
MKQFFPSSTNFAVYSLKSNPKCFNLFCRYGREDEEVMGLKFCNEAIIALQQIWPKIETEQRFGLSPLQVNYKKGRKTRSSLLIQSFRKP